MSSLASGTRTIPLRPFQDRDEHYQSISMQAEYAPFSHEELRVVDYQQGNGKLAEVVTTQQAFTFPRIPAAHNMMRFRNRAEESHMNLLRGAAIEIHTGVAPQPSMEESASSDQHEIWYLPQRLISHYSPFLKKACSLDFKERHENRIDLPTDEPRIFSCFVEWMYYGSYTRIPSREHVEENDNISPDVKCWVLGDKFLCPEFQNLAMAQIYEQHESGPFKRVLTVKDAQFVNDHTSEGSKLRMFFFDYIASYFSTEGRLHGNIEHWDELLLNYSDLRLQLLKNLMSAAGAGERRVKGIEVYFEAVTSA